MTYILKMSLEKDKKFELNSLGGIFTYLEINENSFNTAVVIMS